MASKFHSRWLRTLVFVLIVFMPVSWAVRTYQPTGRVFTQIEERTTIPDRLALRGLATIAALRTQARSVTRIVATMAAHLAQFFLEAFA